MVMGSITKIQWCDHTFNPWRGCTKVHTGCLNCYAEKQSKRNPGVLGIWGDHGTRVVASEEMWEQPLKWNAAAKADGVRRRVFCASLADVFEEWAGPVHDSQSRRLWVSNRGTMPIEPDTGEPGFAFERTPLTLQDVRRRLFELIDETPWLDWLLLTKRPENVRRMMPNYSYHACHTGDCPHDVMSQCDPNKQFRQNVWLGTSISDQATADKAIPELLKCRDLAPVLFVSVEPLVRRIILRKFLPVDPNNFDPEFRTGLDWLIIGGESGPKARPCDVEWIRDAVEECQRSAIPVFVKQLGAVPIDTTFRSPSSPAILTSVKDHKGGDPHEWPAELRVREFPDVNE